MYSSNGEDQNVKIGDIFKDCWKSNKNKPPHSTSKQSSLTQGDLFTDLIVNGNIDFLQGRIG